jgi:hypothetical protein
MYNLLSFILSDRPELPGTRRFISLLKSDIKKVYENTFTSNTGNALRHGEHVYHDRQVVDAFTRAGYKLDSYKWESFDDDEIFLEPMNEVKQPSTMFVDLN